MKKKRIVLISALLIAGVAAGLFLAEDDAGKIFNTQHNELGTMTGGQLGDQNGKEARIEHYPLYYMPSSYPWDYLLHCTREDVRLEAAALACEAAENDNIGYDCGEFGCTFWEEAEKNGCDVAGISTPCAAQCATAVLTFYKCAGYRLDIEELKQIDVDKSVWDMDDVLCGTGLFEKIYDEDRLHSPDHNVAGDVYVAESRHTIIQVTDGSGAGG